MAIPPDPTPPGELGVLVIGESPIGDPLFNWWDVITSQYANSPIILQIIDYIAQNIDQTPLISEWFDNVWNIQTAEGYGLDVWGRIVGVSRNVLAEPTIYLGFAEGGSLSYSPFGQGPFYSSGSSDTNYTMTDTQFRQVILAKAAANIWDGTILGLNKILRTLFPGQVAYVIDNQNMTVTYTFGFALLPWQIAVLLTSGVLPRPSGVQALYAQI